MVDHINAILIISLHFKHALHESLTRAYLDIDLIALLTLNFSFGNENLGAVVRALTIKFLTFLESFASLVITMIIVEEERVDAPIRVRLVGLMIALHHGRLADGGAIRLFSLLVALQDSDGRFDSCVARRIFTNVHFLLEILNFLILGALVGCLNFGLGGDFDEHEPGRCLELKSGLGGRLVFPLLLFLKAMLAPFAEYFSLMNIRELLHELYIAINLLLVGEAAHGQSESRRGRIFECSVSHSHSELSDIILND